MSFDLKKYEQEARNAIKIYWGTKDKAAIAQVERGKRDIGSRGAVTAGKHLDAFVPLLSDIARARGLEDITFHAGQTMAALPGFFRPTKRWDLLIMHKDQLIAVFELKSMGSSFSNNLNNRSEEAIGSAHDFWTAFKADAFGQNAPRPFVGWLLIMSECPQSMRPVKTTEPHFPVLKEFNGASYAERADLLCRRLMHEQLYTAAALMLTTAKKGKTNGDYRHLSDSASFRRFLATFIGHMTTIAAEESGTTT